MASSDFANKIKHSFNKLFLLSVAFLFFTGCSNMESRWETAKAEDTSQAYEVFLKEYPDSIYKSEAVERQKMAVERVQFKYVFQKDEIAYYERFKNDHPQSRYLQEVQQKIDAKIKYLKGLPEIANVKIARKEGAKESPVDGVLFQALKDSFTIYGFNVKSNDEQNFDVLLSIGEVKLFIPAGTVMDFKFTSQENGSQRLEGSSPTKLGVSVQFDVYHRNGGALLLGKEIEVLDVSSDPQDPKTLDKISTLGKKIVENTISCVDKYANVRKK
jgi:hypothetical protein